MKLAVWKYSAVGRFAELRRSACPMAILEVIQKCNFELNAYISRQLVRDIQMQKGDVVTDV